MPPKRKTPPPTFDPERALRDARADIAANGHGGALDPVSQWLDQFAVSDERRRAAYLNLDPLLRAVDSGDLERDLNELHTRYTRASAEERATGFDDDGRPRLGALLAAASHAEAEADAEGSERARHHAAGLRAHVRAQLDRMCGVDYGALKGVFGLLGVGDEERMDVLADAAERSAPGTERSRSQGEASEFEDLLLSAGPARGVDAVEDAARDAALAAYRATKRAAAAARADALEENKQRALVELARLAHEIEPNLRPIVAYRTALTMYIAQKQAFS